MPPTIVNPILNSPYREPTRHFRFDEDGITAEIEEGRRISSYFVPIPAARRQAGGQLSLATQGDWTAERMQPNAFINRIREHVALWRKGDYPGITAVTRELLRYWRSEDRAAPVFFCQFEALETAIFIAEVAGHSQPWIERELREANDGKNPGLYRIAFKMATGSGKTVVMAMLVAWQVLNKLANPQDKRFSDTFLIVTPGITIRDRLGVLLPNDPGNYYKERDLATPDQIRQLQAATILITNFHAFLPRETINVSTTTKKLLVGASGDVDRFKETPAQVVRRVCRSLGTKKNIVVLNDEAHHCYQSAGPADVAKEAVTADERADVNRSKEEARIWLNGLRAVKAKLGIRAVYDLSATPFFLKGSGYKEGLLFPWVVSDFSLIDAIESGVVKIPRVPVADNTMATDGPVYRELWSRIRDELPRRGRDTEALGPGRPLPAELEGALLSLYANYQRSYEAWKAQGSGTPPVFIVVCQNTSISKLVFDWIAGHERTVNGATVIVPGNLPLFSNVVESVDAAQNRWQGRPNTLLIDSAQLESGGAMDPAFRKIAAVEIAEFKEELRRRDPSRADEDVPDEELLREVMNTVGKAGRLGEHIRCVVSVSMLTEGWDANTVSHILGIRAFGTQLLCEQVIGRGLRRVSYEADEHGMFAPEYAEVYGVPFSFIPTEPPGPQKPRVLPAVHRVVAQPDKAQYELTFPHLLGYRFDLPTERISATFDEASRMMLATDQVPTWIEVDPIVGEKAIMDLDDLRKRRMQEVAFRIAKRTLDRFFRTEGGDDRPWLFPQLVGITQRWLDTCVTCKDDTFPQLLLLSEWESVAAEKIYRSVDGKAKGADGEPRLLPLLRPYDHVGTTARVDFTTTKPVWPAEKSHLNWVAEDSSWESKVAQTLDHMPEVHAYVKNQGLGLRIPYTFEGLAAHYVPDLLVRLDDGRADPLNLLIEVTGQRRKDKAAKVDAAQKQWVPAVNNHGGFGRWSFIEVTDKDNAATLIRAHILASRSE